MGFRFQKRISLLPGVRINLSKSGVSTSLGPRGADVNIGPHGVSTNAGIPGTGISYRRKLGGGRKAGKTGLFGILAVVGGLGFWAFQHQARIAHFLAPSRPQAVAGTTPAPVNTASPGLRFVHRGGSVIRDEPKTSGHTLKKESKGAQVTLLSEGGGWSKVTDGTITGWMRSSILGAEPPR